MERNKVYYSDLQRYKKAKEAEAEEKRKKQEEEKRKIERELEHGPSGIFQTLNCQHLRVFGKKALTTRSLFRDVALFVFLAHGGLNLKNY